MNVLFAPYWFPQFKCMHIKFLTFFLYVVGLAGNLSVQENWQQFKSISENFMIALPAEPKQEQSRGNGPLGNGHHIYSLEHKQISYTISNSRFDTAPTKKNEMQSILESATKMLVMVTGGKVIRDKEIELEGFPGREIRVEKDKRLTILRVYLVKERVYQLLTMQPKTKEDHPDTIKFYDSFKLLKRPE